METSEHMNVMRMDTSAIGMHGPSNIHVRLVSDISHCSLYYGFHKPKMYHLEISVCKIMMPFQIKDLEIISQDHIYEYTRTQKCSEPVPSIGGEIKLSYCVKWHLV